MFLRTVFVNMGEIKNKVYKVYEICIYLYNPLYWAFPDLCCSWQILRGFSCPSLNFYLQVIDKLSGGIDQGIKRWTGSSL